MCCNPNAVYTLLDFSEWLHYKAWCHNCNGYVPSARTKEKRRHQKRTIVILHSSKESYKLQLLIMFPSKMKSKKKPYCPYCENTQQDLSQRSAIQKNVEKD